MSAAKTPRLVTPPEPSDEPAVIKAIIRGQKYTFSEITMERYDELMKKATSKVHNEVTGETDEVIDQTLLMRLMILECVRPRPEGVMRKGVRLYRAFARIVNDLHYGEEPVEIDDDDDDVLDDGESQGNADD